MSQDYGFDSKVEGKISKIMKEIKSEKVKEAGLKLGELKEQMEMSQKQYYDL